MIDLEARGRAFNERVVAEASPVELVLRRARRYRVRRRLAATAVTACVVAGGVGVVAWANNGDARGVRTVDSTTVSPVNEAERVAVDLRDSAVLPAGAQPYLGAPPSALRGPFESQVTPNIVDAHRIWIVDEPSEQVITFLRGHTPHGLSTQACCAFGRGTDGVVNMVQYFDAATSSVIESANLQMSVARRSATTTWVRADAQVVWRARRDPSERVPTSDRVITITRVPTMTIGTSSAAPRPVVVTDREQVERLESSFNDLLVAVPDVRNGCQGPTYTVRFSATEHSVPDVVATVNCGDAGVTIDGRRAAPLNASLFTSQVAALVPN